MSNFALSEIKKLPFDFEHEVASFLQAKKDHLTTEGVPAPTHHPWVEMAVRRIPGRVEKVGATTVTHPDEFVADYNIIDDTPPPPTLDEKKLELANGVNNQAMALVNQIYPPLKRKHLDFKVNDAQLAIANEQATNGKEPASAADRIVIAEHKARQMRIEDIFRHAADLESQIHDLTEDQVDVWQGAPFPDAK